MTDVGGVDRRAVPALAVGGVTGPAPSGGAAVLLPAPSTVGSTSEDVMSLLYALTAKQRDSDTAQRGSSAERKGKEREAAFVNMRAELEAEKKAREDGSWLDSVTKTLDAACDCVVGGNPVQDLAHSLSEATGTKAFEVAYDFIRPDALLHAAVCLAAEVSGRDEVTEVYDLRPWEAPKAPSAGLQDDAAGSSLKTRFRAAADMSDAPEVMEAYAVTRTLIASAMVSVATCGTGTVAMVAVATSAALAAESKADLLGEAGVGEKEKMWLRLGAQSAMVVGTAGVAFGSGASKVAVGLKLATAIVNGANQIARGSVDVGKALYEREASEHTIEAARHEGAQGQLDRQQQHLIVGLRELSQSYQRTLETIAGTMKDGHDTHLMLARQIA